MKINFRIFALFIFATIVAVAWVFGQDVTTDPSAVVTTITNTTLTTTPSWVATMGTWVGYLAIAIVPIDAILRLIPSDSPAFSFLKVLMTILQKIIDVFHYIFPDNRSSDAGGGRHLDK